MKIILLGSKVSAGYRSKNYTLFDTYTAALAAGSVNTTSAEPVGGARSVTDTNSKISITGGVLNFATGAVANDGVWYSALARQAGRTLLASMILANNTTGSTIGWDATAGSTINDAIYFFATSQYIYVRANATSVLVGGYEAATYKTAVVCRASGMFYFIKGGAFTNWTMIWSHLLGSAATTPGINATSTTSIFTVNDLRVPKRLFVPVPLCSDGMSAATTDGLGNAEGNGTAGTAYTNVGTWGVAGGVRSCSALSGGLGFSYLASSSSNILIEAVCTRSSGVAGMVARYVDANNYLIAYLDGTNAKLDKVVAGVTTNLISAAVTYGANFVLRLMLDGTTAGLFYNQLYVGWTTVPAGDSPNHGLYTTHTGATFDNFIVWARGNEDQYSGLNGM